MPSFVCFVFRVGCSVRSSYLPNSPPTKARETWIQGHAFMFPFVVLEVRPCPGRDYLVHSTTETRFGVCRIVAPES